MSADNWAICPKCVHEARTKAEREKIEVMALYGAVHVEEFIRRREDLVEVDPSGFNTFCEDYEIGVNDGDLEWDYTGCCTVCGLKVQSAGSKQFWPEEEIT